MMQGTGDSMDTQHRLDVLEPWISTTNPGSTNDGVDTAGIGKSFYIGSCWINKSGGSVHFCYDNTTNAAHWT